jgi:hypothetical protein
VRPRRGVDVDVGDGGQQNSMGDKESQLDRGARLFRCVHMESLCVLERAHHAMHVRSIARVSRASYSCLAPQANMMLEWTQIHRTLDNARMGNALVPVMPPQIDCSSEPCVMLDCSCWAPQAPQASQSYDLSLAQASHRSCVNPGARMDTDQSQASFCSHGQPTDLAYITMLERTRHFCSTNPSYSHSSRSITRNAACYRSHASARAHITD